MAALAWAAFVPASLYVTRAIGNSVTQTVLRRRPAEAPDYTIDTDAVLSTADIAMNMKSFSPTAEHLQKLIGESAKRLRELIAATQSRVERHSWSRIFRDPDFSEENIATLKEVETLKSRIHLYFSVINLFPGVKQDFFSKTITKQDEYTSDSDEEESAESAECKKCNESSSSSGYSGGSSDSTPEDASSFQLSSVFPNIFAASYHPHGD